MKSEKRRLISAVKFLLHFIDCKVYFPVLFEMCRQRHGVLGQRDASKVDHAAVRRSAGQKHRRSKRKLSVE